MLKEKNAKVRATTHKKMSIMATILEVQKNVLVTALLEAAMLLPNEVIKAHINIVTNNDINNALSMIEEGTEDKKINDQKGTTESR